MVTTTQTHKNGSAESGGRQNEDGNKVHVVQGPRHYSVKGLREMAHPDRECPDGKDRYYAVAQLDCVESTGPRARDSEEFIVVRYVTADRSKGLDVTFIPDATPHEEIPRTKDVSPDNEKIGVPNPSDRKKYAKIIENHREVERQIEVTA